MNVLWTRWRKTSLFSRPQAKLTYQTPIRNFSWVAASILWLQPLYRMEGSLPRNQWSTNKLVLMYSYTSPPFCLCEHRLSFSWSRILGRTIALRFLGIILRVLRLELIKCLHYKPVSTTFAQGGKIAINLKRRETLPQLRPRIRPLNTSKIEQLM